MIVCVQYTLWPQVLTVSLDQQLPRNDEEGRVSLLTEEDDVSMHDTQIPGAIRPKETRRKGCCGVK